MSKFVPYDPDSINQTVGERLRDYRMARRLTQAKLSDLSDVDRAYIGRIENNQVKVSLHIIVRLLNVLEVKLEDLLCFSLAADEEDQDASQE